jgi:predicted negative regulator of RcsB-dependent stress response
MTIQAYSQLEEDAMSHLRVIICRVEDEAPKEQMTELASFDLAEVAVTKLKPETALEGLETTTQTVGQAVLRELLKQQWVEIDQQLVRQYQQEFSP